MMRTLAETGNGWMTFKDSSNQKCNQTSDHKSDNDYDGGTRVVHLSNLCTEIIEVTNQSETAVCNLGSLNLGSFVTTDEIALFDYEELGKTGTTGNSLLTRVIDINFYPINEAGNSNNQWRPVGLGMMGLQDVFFKMQVPLTLKMPEKYLTNKRRNLFQRVMGINRTRRKKWSSRYILNDKSCQRRPQFDLWGVEPTDQSRWEELRKQS